MENQHPSPEYGKVQRLFSLREVGALVVKVPRSGEHPKG